VFHITFAPIINGNSTDQTNPGREGLVAPIHLDSFANTKVLTLPVLSQSRRCPSGHVNLPDLTKYVYIELCPCKPFNANVRSGITSFDDRPSTVGLAGIIRRAGILVMDCSITMYIK
jgi:hypothetical protein